MSDNNVLIDQQGSVLIIQMNRPEKKNALTGAMYKAMSNALRDANADDSVGAVVLTGHPECFSAGNDVSDFLNNGSDGSSPVMNLLLQLVNFEKPLVAAVNGIAVGIGVTMLLHCDLVYVADNARLRLPFVNLALVPEAASSLLLPNIMGHQRASELLLLGDFFDGQKAREYGVANDALPEQQVLSHALEKAEALAAKPRESIRLTKQLLKKTHQDAVEHRVGEEGMIFAKRLMSDEAREVMMAFMSGKS